MHATQTDVDRLLEAILPHVPFEGWSKVALDAAADDLGMSAAELRAAAPGGAQALAALQHQRGDGEMTAALAARGDLGEMRYRDKVALLIWLRLEAAGDKESVRRASSLFALPHMAPKGAQLIWGTADAIWQALGDQSDDVNWYTKRATLSAVYGAVVLFWLGDTSEDGADTRAFIDRRIENVMQIEKVKANPVLKPLSKLFAGIHAPRGQGTFVDDLPGRSDAIP
ncbi:MAG: COQ9 family protein [Rhodobacteraceae bacterium]|nr:COQ9 family protein [Paracoccaceae bacterium]